MKTDNMEVYPYTTTDGRDMVVVLMSQEAFIDVLNSLRSAPGVAVNVGYAVGDPAHGAEEVSQ